MGHAKGTENKELQNRINIGNEGNKDEQCHNKNGIGNIGDELKNPCSISSLKWSEIPQGNSTFVLNPCPYLHLDGRK